MKRLSAWRLLSLLLVSVGAVSGTSLKADALLQSVDGVLMAGFYQLSGENSTKRKVSLSGPGAYLAQCELGFKNQFRASLGINYLISDGLSGDTAWGMSLGVKYFPWSWN